MLSYFSQAFQQTQQIAQLAVALYCQGIKLDDSSVSLKNWIVQRRAGLGSGLELILPSPKKNFWINVPVLEHFVEQSPYYLCKDVNGYYIKKIKPLPTMSSTQQVAVHESETQVAVHEPETQVAAKKTVPLLVAEDTLQSAQNETNTRWPVQVLHPPNWYNQMTSRGILMSKIGVLQGSYLGIYVGKPCAFWQMSPPKPCQFCATGRNVGIHEAEEKTISDVVETARAAKKHSHITFVHLNSGYQQGQDLSFVLPYVKALKKEVGILVGVQCIPSENTSEYDTLISAGVDHLSFCYEFHDPEYFARYLPGKAEYIGQKRFFTAMEYSAKHMKKGSVSGEIIAGIEPISATLAAIEYITKIGAFPTVCIFRPLLGTALQNYPSPSVDDMLIIFRKVASACQQHHIPVGLVPNLEVSLVMTPDDCRYLADLNFAWYSQHYILQILKFFAAPYFKWKQSRL